MRAAASRSRVAGRTGDRERSHRARRADGERDADDALRSAGAGGFRIEQAAADGGAHLADISRLRRGASRGAEGALAEERRATLERERDEIASQPVWLAWRSASAPVSAGVSALRHAGAARLGRQGLDRLGGGGGRRRKLDRGRRRRRFRRRKGRLLLGRRRRLLATAAAEARRRQAASAATEVARRRGGGGSGDGRGGCSATGGGGGHGAGRRRFDRRRGRLGRRRRGACGRGSRIFPAASALRRAAPGLRAGGASG